MHTYRLALIGFGNVGQGFARLLSQQGEKLATQYGFRVSIVAVCDLLKGSAYDPDGLDPDVLLASVQRTGTLKEMRAPSNGWDASRTIQKSNADVVVELSYTDLRTGEPALRHIQLALERGCHVLTSNKGPIALAYPKLASLARKHDRELGIEGTVMSGTPALRLGRDLQASTTIKRIQGIFNGTTNFILTRVEQGATYEQALAEAQSQGYTEADPTADVEGYDTAAKILILAHLFMDTPLSMGEIDRSGMTHLTREAIVQAQAANARWKFLGSLERTAEGLKAQAGLVRLPVQHFLASIQGPTNAIMYSTDILGEVTLVGPGAGRMETAFALMSDLIAVHRKRQGDTCTA